MKLIILIVALISTSFSLLLAQPGEPHLYIEQNFDVLEYKPDIIIEDPASKFIRGVNTIKLRWITPKQENSFYFHTEDLKIDSVLYDGERIIYSEVFVSGGITAYNKITPNVIEEIAEIKIYYSGKMTSEGGSYNWGGVHYDAGILYAMGVGIYNDYVSCTRHWLPCYDLPADKALYTATFTVPDTLYVLSNGKLISKVDTLEDFTKYTWTLGEATAATYLLTFAVGKFSEIDIESSEVPTKIYMYDKQSSIDAGKYAFKLVPEMIEAFNTFFDFDYPFETMSYYGASKGAMEHQTMVTMSNSQILSTSSAKDSMYSTAAHELAHQWFGNLVTPYDFRDAWLNEGFATYAEHIWAEHKLGTDGYEKSIQQDRNRYLNSVAQQENHLPLYNFSEYTVNNYPSTIYVKGGLILALIRELVGDEIFKSKINEYLAKYAESNVRTSDLEEIFGDNLDKKFWQQWVYGRGYPSLDITYQSGAESDYIIAEQRDNEYQIFDLTLRYSVKTDLGQEVEFEHNINSKIDTLTLPNGIRIGEVEIIDNYYLYKIMSINKITNVTESENPNSKIKCEVVNRILDINFENKANYVIEIVTLDGKRMLINEGFYFGSEKFDLNTFADGAYFVYIRWGEQSIVKKIMVN